MDTRQDGVTLAEAARRLGLTAETVRKRLQRGSLAGYKREGAWYVVLGAEAVPPCPPDSPAGQPATPAGQEQDSGRTDLSAHLVAEVDYLRAELTRSQEQLSRALDQLADERRRADTIMAMLTSRPQELAPPQPAPTSPVDATERPQEPPASATPPPAPPTRPWWRRWLG